ncbi:MAG: hypothetical protein WC889_06745 [Myxococcota bacterium]|jgi:hypothetical protein
MRSGWIRIYAAAAGIFLAGTACVIPPDIEPPPVVNNGPVISRDMVDPLGPFVDIQASQCESRLFSVPSVIEIDLTDTIYYRWFADYENYRDQKLLSMFNPGRVPPVTAGGESRAIPTLDLDLKTNFAFINASKGTLHTLELVVADRPFIDDPNPKTVQAGGKTDSYLWVLRPQQDCRER